MKRLILVLVLLVVYSPLMGQMVRRPQNKGAGAKALTAPRLPAPPALPPVPPLRGSVLRALLVPPPAPVTVTNPLFGPVWIPVVNGRTGQITDWTNHNFWTSNFVYRATNLTGPWVLVFSGPATGGVYLSRESVAPVYFKTTATVTNHK